MAFFIVNDLLLFKIRERNLNGTRSVANLEGQQISALSNRVLSTQNKKSIFGTAINSLPSVSNVKAAEKLRYAEQRASQKGKNKARKEARNAKSYPFNNS